MKSNTKINNMIVALAAVVLLISLANLAITFVKVAEFKEKLTGYALLDTARGSVNLTINSVADINFTTDSVNFSSGAVTPPNTNATLKTNGAGAATITNGNWSTGARALVLANIGNSANCSISLSGAKTAAQFFGGTASQQMYQWNITNKEEDSCIFNTTTNNARGIFGNVNTSQIVVCNQFSSEDTKNEIFIDFRLVVPDDAANTGAIGDEITATCNTPL